MGHYWSEIQPDHEPERHPFPLDAMDFQQVDRYGYQWAHRPCAQVFYISRGHMQYSRKIPDNIYWHANHCPRLENDGHLS